MGRNARATAVIAAMVAIAGAPTAPAKVPPVGYGKAEVAVGPLQGRVWNPKAGLPVTFLVHARIPSSQRGKVRIFVRYARGIGRCGTSYLRGRGTSYGSFSSNAANAAGYISVRARTTRTVAQPGLVRFCVWIAPHARSVVAPTIQDVWFVDELFGASLTSTGIYSASPPDGQPSAGVATIWDSVGTTPFTYQRTTTDCSGAQPHTDVVIPLEPDTTVGFVEFRGGYAAPLEVTAACNEVVTHKYAVTTRAGQVVGSIALTGAQRRTRPPVVTRLGNACALDGDLRADVSEATAYLLAVGCRPGRVVTRAGNRPGMVTGFEIHGALARIARLGTKVDIAVTGPSA